MTPAEWTAVAHEIVRGEELRERGKYERMRVMAYCAALGYTDRSAEQFLPLPWDKEPSVEKEKTSATEVTEDDIERMARQFDEG